MTSDQQPEPPNQNAATITQFNLEGFLDQPVPGQLSDSDARPDGWRRAVTGSVSPLLLVVIVWGAGTVLLWGLSLWRISRLQRCLRFAEEASADVQQTTALLAERLGLRRCPRVWQVPGRVSPMLWAFVGPVRIVVPSELFSDLDGPARETLLLHELVHYRRGDHWIRWLELVSLGLYWWHPIAWLLRREIRLAEELACDACVVSQRPTDRRAYAEMLVKTVAFLSSDDLPSLATGVGTKGSIEERLRKIMLAAFDVRVSRRMKFVVCLVAILFIPLAPILIRAQRADVKTSAAQQTTATASGDSVTVRGTLVDPDGNPQSGIRVAVDWLTQTANQGVNRHGVGEEDLGSATTDRNGTFVIRLPAGAHPALAPQDLDWQRRRITIKPDTRDLGRITLARAGRIQGRVVDTATGKPLESQRVFAQAQDSSQVVHGFVSFGSAMTDREGQYVIGGLSPGRFNVLFGGSVPTSEEQPLLTAPAVEGVDVSVARPAQADFHASTGRRLSGKVLDSDTGKPLAKISVGYYGPARPSSGAACMMVRTKADGTFEFHVPPGVSKIYVAEGDRRQHTESSRTLEVPADRDVVDVVLQAGVRDARGRRDKAVATAETEKPARTVNIPAPDAHRPYRLHVTLQTPAGRKVNRVEARVVHKGSQRTSQWIALSATGHEIQFPRDDDGLTTFLLIDSDGYATARSAEFVVRERMPNLAVELVPEVPAPVRGKVVDQAGKAVEGARVRIARVIYGSQQTFPWGLEYTTGNDGRFRNQAGSNGGPDSGPHRQAGDRWGRERLDVPRRQRTSNSSRHPGWAARSGSGRCRA